MPKTSQKAEVSSFVGGLITEASPLNFPSNASADEVNFDLHRDGSRTRRLGMDYEDGAVFTETGLSLEEISSVGWNSYRWLAAGGNPDVNFAVIQLANQLWLFNIDQDPITQNGAVGSVTIAQFATDTVFSITDVEGILVLASGSEQYAVVQYINGSFSVTYDRILTRDLWGVQETEIAQYEVDPTYRGGESSIHRYNLQNQSWGIPRADANGVVTDPINTYKNYMSVLPGNAEQVWAGLQYQAVSVNQTPYERIFPNLYNEILGANTLAARGYFIIDALRRGQGRIDALAQNAGKYSNTAIAPALLADYSPYGPKCVAEFAGRIFYGGFRGEVVGGDTRSPNYANYLFFSQLVKSLPDINKCYQDGDPTSRDSSDVVDTDGGFVRISGAQNIIAMRSIGINLVIIAENGVWYLTGGTQESGFSATSYKVSKISAFGGLSESSVVVEGDECYYWANDGIYKIGQNQFGDLQVTSMTLTTIQKLYQAIPNSGKLGAFGGYDQINKKIRWVYKTGELFTANSVTKELIYDSLLNAFTVNQIVTGATVTTELMSMFQSQLFVTAANPTSVFSDSDQVYADTDDVVTDEISSVASIQYLRYLAVSYIGGSYKLSIASYHQVDFLDWKSVDGVGNDAKAYCLTGSSTGGDSSIDKQTPYLTMTFNRTESGVDVDLQPLKQSSCYMRSQWNFANAVQSNKWSPLVQAYRYRKVRFSESTDDLYDTGFSVIQSKNKLRGRGKAFALYFETEAGKDCQILGWNLAINVNQIT